MLYYRYIIIGLHGFMTNIHSEKLLFPIRNKLSISNQETKSEIVLLPFKETEEKLARRTCLSLLLYYEYLTNYATACL